MRKQLVQHNRVHFTSTLEQGFSLEALALHQAQVLGGFFTSLSTRFPLSDLSCHYFRTNWISRLGLHNQVGSTNDHLANCYLPSTPKDRRTMRAELTEKLRTEVVGILSTHKACLSWELPRPVSRLRQARSAEATSTTSFSAKLLFFLLRSIFWPN